MNRKMIRVSYNCKVVRDRIEQMGKENVSSKGVT
jgi:hypothetical protein